MEFCKDRVFTAANADELKPGDKVIVADDMTSLRTNIEHGQTPFVIKDILIEDERARFRAVGFGVENDWLLAYLVERKENCTNCVKCENCVPLVVNLEAVKRYNCKFYERAEPKTEQKHYRPFKDTDELIKVFCEKTPKIYDKDDEKLFMPYIWVREKGCEKSAGLITCYGSKGITVRGKGMYFDTLFTMFEFLDGSPCGVEE